MASKSGHQLYQSIGNTHAEVRRPDPRIQELTELALGYGLLIARKLVIQDWRTCGGCYENINDDVSGYTPLAPSTIL